MKRWVSNLLIALLGGIFLISACYLTDYFVRSRKQQAEFDALAGIVEQGKQPTGRPEETTAALVTNPESGEQLLPEYAPLYEMNPDMVGWMRLADTKLNYPVMQTPDRENYYLHTGFNGEYSSHGCLYVSETCDVNTPSDNITIYGHNMKDGSMFAPLLKYGKKSFWESNPYISFDTLTEHRTYQVIAVFRTTATAGEGFAYHLFTDAADAADFDEYVAECKRLALYDTGITAAYGDQLITLSTCEYSQVNGRLVVVAKRVAE